MQVEAGTPLRMCSKGYGVAPLGYKWNEKAELIVDEIKALIKFIFEN